MPCRRRAPSQAADTVASFMDLRPEEKQQILESFDLRARLDKVLELLEHRIEVLKICATSASRPGMRSRAASASTSCASS